MNTHFNELTNTDIAFLAAVAVADTEQSEALLGDVSDIAKKIATVMDVSSQTKAVAPRKLRIEFLAFGDAYLQGSSLEELNLQEQDSRVLDHLVGLSME